MCLCNSIKRTCKIFGMWDGHTLIDCPFKYLLWKISKKLRLPRFQFSGRNKKLRQVITWSGRWIVSFAACSKEREQKRGVRGFLVFFLHLLCSLTPHESYFAEDFSWLHFTAVKRACGRRNTKRSRRS